MAYNEEANIGKLLEAVFTQRLNRCHLNQIFVVASGCTDRTVEIARAYEAQDARLRVIVQEARQGKASAINLFLKQAQGEICIVESADTIPGRYTYENLVLPFLDSQVGMTGSRPIPVNSTKCFIGYCAHFLWGLHHSLALKHPKLGELIAFRNQVQHVPENTAVDEASVEQIITQAGYTLCYAPQAIVYNKGPETVADFIRQRRRIATGHMHLKSASGYAPSTTSLNLTFMVLGERLKLGLKKILRLVKKKKPPWLIFCYSGRQVKYAIWAAGAIALEATARFLGWYDLYLKGRNPVSWEPIASTKRLGK